MRVAEQIVGTSTMASACELAQPDPSEITAKIEGFEQLDKELVKRAASAKNR